MEFETELGIQGNSIADIEAAASEWGRGAMSALRSSALAVAHEGGDLAASITTDTRRLSDDSLSIRFTFLRYGVFREKGAGRGYAGRKGSKWTSASGKLRTTNPNSLGKMGTGKRKLPPWFNPVIRSRVGELREIVAERYVMKVRRLFIK